MGTYKYIVIKFIEDSISIDILNTNPVNYGITIMLNNGETVNIF
jgi:hypothetical protein